MGFYAERILPFCLDLAMRNRMVRERRAVLVPQARGEVLEIGIGSGLNLPFYSSAVLRVRGIDPSPGLLAIAREKTGGTPFSVELICGSAEQLPVADASVDTAVSTWTLCSVPDAARALAEIRRVLKPGGKLLLVEHGRAPDAGVRRWQDRLNPAWHALAGGCNMNRDMNALVRGAGFGAVSLETRYLPGAPRILGYHYEGTASVLG